MATLDALTYHAPVTAPKAAVTGTAPEAAAAGTGESLADRGLAVAGMAGAVCGAIAGAAVGAGAGSMHPEFWGMAGTMLGSGLVAAGWYLAASVWAAFSPHR